MFYETIFTLSLQFQYNKIISFFKKMEEMDRAYVCNKLYPFVEGKSITNYQRNYNWKKY